MRLFGILCCLLCSIISSYGQIKSERSLTRQGNRLMADSNFVGAEAKYIESLSYADIDTNNYNLALALYRQQKWEEALSKWSTLEQNGQSEALKSMCSFAQGMSVLQSGMQSADGQMDYEKINEGIDHFKQAMRYAPGNEAARHNYRFLKSMLQQNPPPPEQQQYGDQQNKEQKESGDSDNKEQNENSDSQGNGQNQSEDQEGKNNNKSEEDQQGNGDDKDPSSEQNEEGDQKNKQSSQPQPKEGQISREQAQRLLEALGKQEEKTMDKVKAKKVKGNPKKSKKDW